MLVFSMRVGEAFYVADLRVVLEAVHKNGVKLLAGEDLVPVPWSGADRQTVPLIEGVRVCARVVGGAVRVGVEAPFEVKILRESLYLKSQEGRVVPRPRGRRVALRGPAA